MHSPSLQPHIAQPTHHKHFLKPRNLVPQSFVKSTNRTHPQNTLMYVDRT